MAIIYYFSPPTHEEPIRTEVRPLVYYRYTWANTIFWKDGAFQSRRTPPAEFLTGTEGEDYFIGGHIYEVTPTVASLLEAHGFTVDEVEITEPGEPPTEPTDPPEYGLGAYGEGIYGS